MSSHGRVDLLALLVAFWSTVFLVVSLGTRGVEGFVLLTISLMLVLASLVYRSLQEQGEAGGR